MAPHAAGPFDVQLTPQASDAPGEGVTLGRTTIQKTWYGDLQGTSLGEMLTASTGTPGSAAYSALERVSGTLHGRTGTFALQHTGIMNRGVPLLTITVVPDSGTGELRGISGTLGIRIDDGRHEYTFDYTLDAAE